MTALTRQAEPSPPSLPTVTSPLPQAEGMLGLTLSTKSRDAAMAEIAGNPQALSALRDFLDHAEAMMVPAAVKQIAGHIERLTLHYWTKPLDSASMRLYVRDWIDDVGHLPVDVLASACAQWRRGANAFMPTPGQLLALADPILRYRRALAQRAASLIDDAEKSPAR